MILCHESLNLQRIPAILNVQILKYSTTFLIEITHGSNCLIEHNAESILASRPISRSCYFGEDTHVYLNLQDFCLQLALEVEESFDGQLLVEDWPEEI